MASPLLQERSSPGWNAWRCDSSVSLSIEEVVVAQRGQVFPMKSNGPGGTLWGYRYRTGGRGSRRVQRGGFVCERDARESLERALERARRANGTGTTLTLAGLVEEYLDQHDAEPETIAKLS
jgi:hypothetical protein